MRAVRNLHRSTTEQQKVGPAVDTGTTQRCRPTFYLPSWLRLPNSMICATLAASPGARVTSNFNYPDSDSPVGERSSDLPVILPVDSLLLTLFSCRQMSSADVSLTLALARLLMLPPALTDQLRDPLRGTAEESLWVESSPLQDEDKSRHCPCRWGCGRSVPPKLLRITAEGFNRFPTDKSAPMPKSVIELAFCGRGVSHLQQLMKSNPKWSRNAPRRGGGEYPMNRFQVQTLFAASYLYNLPLVMYLLDDGKKPEKRESARAVILKELEARFFRLWAIVCGAALAGHSSLISWALNQWNDAVRLLEDERPRLPMLRPSGKGATYRRDEGEYGEPMQRWQQSMIFACSVRSGRGSVPPLILPLVWTMPDLLHCAIQLGAPAPVVERILLHQRAEYTYRQMPSYLSKGFTSTNRLLPVSSSPPFGQGPTFDAMVYQAFRVALKASPENPSSRSSELRLRVDAVEVLNYRMLRQWVSAADFKECFKDLSPLCLIQSPWILKELLLELTDNGGGVSRAKVLSYLLPNSWPLVDEATSQLHLFTSSEVLNAISKCSRLAPLGFRNWVKRFLKRKHPAGVSSTRWSRDVTLRRIETGLGILHSDVFPERSTRAQLGDEGDNNEQTSMDGDLPWFC